MFRRVLSLWLPRLATDRLVRRQPDWGNRPLVATARQYGRVTVTAAGGPAQVLGIVPGMSLADARALEPALVVAEADPAADARALEGLADWCGRYTPWVGLDGPDGIVLDITGCAHLQGGEAALRTDLVRRLARFGYAARAAVADTPGAAAAVARYGERGTGAGSASGLVVPPGRLREALAGLPVEALRLPVDMATAMRRLGIRRIADLAALPRAGLAARLGSAAVRRYDQVLGITAEPISPRRPLPRHTARLAFAEPLLTPESLDAATAALLERLCAGLETAGQGARYLDLAFFRADGRVERLAVGTSRAVRTPGHLHRLFAEKLDRVEPGPGVEAMVLAATRVEPLAPTQGLLLPAGLPSGFAELPSGFAELIDRLGNRLGLDAAQRLLPRQSWWPERAVDPVPALAGAGVRDSWPADRPRPVRLLPWPEPIEAIAPVPDDPPLQFRWRRGVHRIRRADGPERLEPEWWRELAELRDYYRVEDSDGRRFWVYRAGLYTPERVANWYLHGMFP